MLTDVNPGLDSTLHNVLGIGMPYVFWKVLGYITGLETPKPAYC